MPNILGPLVSTSAPSQKGLHKRVHSLEPIISEADYDPSHVCEFCHRIYRLFSSKQERVVACNSQLSDEIISLAKKKLCEWNSADIKFLLEAYGDTLPPIKSGSGIHMPGQHCRIKTKDHFYGYKSVIQTPIFSSTKNEVFFPSIISDEILGKREREKCAIGKGKHFRKKKLCRRE